jgi:hypothetical protein
LPGHHDLDLLVGGGLPCAGQPDLRSPEEADQGGIGQIWKPGNALAVNGKNKEKRHGIFPHQKDIPFMRHALKFNIISLVTFSAGRGVSLQQGLASVGRVHRWHAD